MNNDDRSRRYNWHRVLATEAGMRTVLCSTGREFTQKRQTTGRGKWHNSNGTASWVGRCPGCHAARMWRYRRRRAIPLSEAGRKMTT